MKKISFLAKNHKRPARLIIIVSFIVLNALGILTGILLADLNFSFSGTAMILFVSAFVVGVILYPSKSGKGVRLSPATHYVKQKSCDFILAASAFCMITYFANRPETLFQQNPVLHAAVITNPALPKDSIAKNYKLVNEFNAAMKDENGKMLKWKERKKMLKEQVKEIKKANNLSNGEKALLVILSVLVAAGLLYLVAALSCSLSCSGSDAAAVLVGLGGIALVIFLLIIAFRAIYGRKKKKEKVAEPSAMLK